MMQIDLMVRAPAFDNCAGSGLRGRPVAANWVLGEALRNRR